MRHLEPINMKAIDDYDENQEVCFGGPAASLTKLNTSKIRRGIC